MISIVLVISLTIGNAFSYLGGQCEDGCPGSGSATCCCCVSLVKDRQAPRRDCCGQAQIANTCCQKTKADSIKSCCSIVDRGIDRDDSTENVCRCSHERSTPSAPVPQRRDNVRIEFPAACCPVDFLASTETSILTPSFLDGVDYGLALMTHTRRQSLLCTWQI
jgi:hypothetical protein